MLNDVGYLCLCACVQVFSKNKLLNWWKMKKVIDIFMEREGGRF